MKNLIIVFALTLLVSIPAFGQKTDSKKVTADFSGIWKIKPANEKSTNEKPALPQSSRSPEEKVVIVQTAEEVIIKNIAILREGEKTLKERRYFIDGRGEINPTDIFISVNDQSSNLKNLQLKSKTKLKGNLLSTRGTSTQGGAAVLTTAIVETWELSKDGTELTHKYILSYLQDTFKPLSAGDSNQVATTIPSKPSITIEIYQPNN